MRDLAVAQHHTRRGVAGLKLHGSPCVCRRARITRTHTHTQGGAVLIPAAVKQRGAGVYQPGGIAGTTHKAGAALQATSTRAKTRARRRPIVQSAPARARFEVCDRH